MGRKKGVQKPQAEISKIKHVQDEDMTLKLKEVTILILNFQVSEILYQIFKFSDNSDLTRFTMQRSNNRSWAGSMGS